MATKTKEINFEDHIVSYLTEKGNGDFISCTDSTYSKELCLIPSEVIEFFSSTQPDQYEELQQQYGDQVDLRICQNLNKNIADRGVVDVLRKGIKDRGQELKLCYFKPNTSKNPLHIELYPMNRFSVIRQLHYSIRNENSIDLVLFLNGIPLLTAELKNALTGQYLHHAVKQYREDRDPNERLLSFKCCLVHMAVSTEEVAMTTHLKADKTYFMPFNLDITNPVNENGFKTAYLWENIWSKDSLLDLIQNFIHYQTDTEKYFDPYTHKLKERKTEKMIFPRYHQLRSVRKLLAALRKDKMGVNYLIEHSAGSGKSNTISWLAHALSGLYIHPDDEKRKFDSIIVVTDRRILDKQLQNNIKQFEQVPGVVEVIDEKKTAQDLKRAIESGKSIIVSTLQKFPVIADTIGHFKERNFAVIVDEAHSSQSGEASRKLKKALSLEEAEQMDSEEKSLDDLILDEISKQGKQKNICFFGFTATPKNKTLQLFCPIKNGEFEIFDKYTMDQAIEEGFILDVLESYASFKRYYRLAKKLEVNDKEYDVRKTVRLLNSYVDITDHAIEIKSRIMLEHFASKSANEIQGKARAMLVTRSRLHAVRYKLKFDELMREMNLPYKALVAFSGTVEDKETDTDYTETNMNNLGGKISIEDAFKLPQYRILIAANKFQTGFDEPMLHTMFVDKKLGGVSTVQTLSRLNRMAAGKNSTMVLDFVNDADKVRKDFQMFFSGVFMLEEDQTDPNNLYAFQSTIDKHQVVTKTEFDEYAEIYFREEKAMDKLQPILGYCVERFELLNEDEREEFRAAANDFVRLYRFLSQIMTFTDVQLEKYYILLSHLLKKLPFIKGALPRDVLNEIVLSSFKVQKEFETSLSLVKEEGQLYGLQGRGGAKQEEAYDLLTNIIKILNDTCGLNLTEQDRVDFRIIQDQLYSNEDLMKYFNPSNSKDNIKDKFNAELDNSLLQFINTKIELYNKLSEDKVNHMMKRMWFNDLYDQRMRGMGK